MKKTGRILSVLLCAVLLLSLCACGSNARKSDNGSGYTTASYSGQTYSYSYDYDDVAVADEAYGGFAASGLYESAAQASSSGTASNGSSGSAGSDEAEDLNPEKIIYSAEATVESTEFDSTINALEALIDSVGGWVESSSVNGASPGWRPSKYRL